MACLNRNEEKMKKSIFNFSNIVLGVFITLFACVAVGANSGKKAQYGLPAQEFIHDPYTKLIALAGTKSQTRISFPPYAIKEVVGDSNKYKMIHDASGASVFLMPKVKVGEKIDLTVITTGGKTQDILLNVKDSEGSVILIKTQENQTSSNPIILKLTEQINKRKLAEAKKLLKAMSYGNKGKYDVTEFSALKCSSSKRHKHKTDCAGNLITTIKNVDEHGMNLDLEIREKKVYRYKVSQLKGLVLEIKNKTKESSSFREEQLSDLFSGTLLTSIKSNQIQANGVIYAFVVLDDSDEQ